MPARLDVREDDREGLLRGEAAGGGSARGFGGDLGDGGGGSGLGEGGGTPAAVRASISSAPPPGYFERASGVVAQFFSQNFMSGFAILFPLVVTVYATLWLIRTFDELVSPIYEAAFGFEIFGLGFVTSMAFIFLVGLLGSSWVGKLFILAGEVRAPTAPTPPPPPQFFELPGSVLALLTTTLPPPAPTPPTPPPRDRPRVRGRGERLTGSVFFSKLGPTSLALRRWSC